MEITELKITPCKDHSPVIATCEATLDSTLILHNITISEGKKGIYVKYPPVCRFTDAEKQKAVSNRILATYVINHCIE